MTAPFRPTWWSRLLVRGFARRLLTEYISETARPIVDHVARVCTAVRTRWSAHGGGREIVYTYGRRGLPPHRTHTKFSAFAGVRIIGTRGSCLVDLMQDEGYFCGLQSSEPFAALRGRIAQQELRIRVYSHGIQNEQPLSPETASRAMQSWCATPTTGELKYAVGPAKPDALADLEWRLGYDVPRDYEAVLSRISLARWDKVEFYGINPPRGFRPEFNYFVVASIGEWDDLLIWKEGDDSLTYYRLDQYEDVVEPLSSSFGASIKAFLEYVPGAE